MNLGLGNLTELKAQLLAGVLRKQDTYDAQLTALGKGVADAFDTFCNRKLARAESDTVILPANSPVFVLPRYPVESISALTQKDERAGSWADVLADLYNFNSASGCLYFLQSLGPETSQLKVTFTGGYWVDTSEDSTGSLPSGATALPSDLKLAWFLQCKKIWEVNDPTGTKIVPSKDQVQLVGLSLAGLELIPQVQQILRGYIRYQMT